MDDKSMSNRCCEKVMQQNMNMTPKWRSESIKQTWTNNTNKHYVKWCKKNKCQKAIRPEGPRPRVPEEVMSSSRDSRSRFPLASNTIKRTNIWQTTKNRSSRTSDSHLARTWRAVRHGADLSIYWAQGPPGIGAHSALPWGSRLSVFVPSTKNYDFQANN